MWKTRCVAHFGNTLAKLRETAGMTQVEFSVKSGVSPSTISKLERSLVPEGTSKTKNRLAEALNLTWEQLESIWLGRTDKPPASTHRLARGPKPMGIPIINQTPGGPAHDYEDVGVDHYRWLGIDPGAWGDPEVFAVQVVGDSMSPRYNSGDVVVLSPAAKTKPGDACFVRFDGSGDSQCTLKRVWPIDAERMELRPDNPGHVPVIVARESIIRMAKIVATVRMES